jgi:hypothetical protein
MFELKDDIPPPVGNGRHVTKYPFKQMQVGQHFDVPLEPYENPAQALSRLRASANKWAKKTHPPARFTCRVADNAVRVWRVE